MTLVGVFVVRGNAERWCPLGGVESLYQYVREGNLICSLGVSNLYILAAVLAATLLLRRAFCGYACPIGTLSEWIQRAARRLGAPRLAVSGRLDRTLGLLKYVVLAVVLTLTWRASELVFRGYDPCYALIGRHGEDIAVWAYGIAGAIIVASLVITVPFCRWFCPLAAVLAPFSRVGLTSIKRRGDACAGCGACARACPMGIAVDQVPQVTAARCTACFQCVDACPKAASSAVGWGPPPWVGSRWPRGLLVVLLLACVGAAVASAYAFPLPSFVMSWGEPPAATASLHLQVRNLTCRDRARRLVDFLRRDDELKVDGYVRIEAWPGPGPAAVSISCDPLRTSEAAIKRAITEPYYDASVGVWRTSPFRIVGYDPLDPGE